jgi:hypothetical protein
LYEKIKDGLIKAPTDLAGILNVRETRGEFLRSVVEHADRLRIGYNSSVEAEIGKLKERLYVTDPSEPGRSSVLTNCHLANRLSELAKPEVSQFFKALDQFTSFDNEEVRLLVGTN